MGVSIFFKQQGTIRYYSDVLRKKPINCRENPRRSEILHFPDRPRSCRGRILFFGLVSDHPRLSGMSTIYDFHQPGKSGTVGKLRNPRSSGILPTLSQAKIRAPADACFVAVKQGFALSCEQFLNMLKTLCRECRFLSRIKCEGLGYNAQ